jgi:quercetin dioxygenase-like cupin family protein
MKINRAGWTASRQGPADAFTGTVRQDPMMQSEPPGRVSASLVTFEPGARTAWHTHPAGQILVVTAGRGWVQSASGPREEITAGDSVWFPAGEKHWHGATDTTAMSHIAITEAVDGSAVTWLEQVTDAEYMAG